MRYVDVDASGIRCSVLGFGCAGIMSRAGRKDSLRALGAAFDAGINFFDTARSYGYGDSEAVLGEFLVGRRDRAVISTKFGILAVRQQLWKRALKPLARKAFSVFPSMRQAARGQIAAQFRGHQFTVESLRKSLDESLRKLRTDYVDFLFMHSPEASVLQQEDLFQELESVVRAGKARVVGISTSPAMISSEMVRGWRFLRAFQFPCNLLNQEETQTVVENANKFVLMANVPFGGTEGRSGSVARLHELSQSPGIPEMLRRKLMEGNPNLLADTALNVITRYGGVHIAIPSMLHLEHVHANVQAIMHSRFSDDEVAWMRRALARPARGQV